MANAIKIIHTADLHLGMQPEKGLPIGRERAREIAETLSRLVSVCNEEDADLLLIAGDVFHKGPLVRELKDVAYQFGKLRRTRVVLIAGNHDYISARSNYLSWIADNRYRPENAAEGSRVTMLSEAEITHVAFPELRTTVYGMSYHTQEVEEPIYDDVIPTGDGIRILLAHGGSPNDAPIDRKRIAGNGWDYVALGQASTVLFIHSIIESFYYGKETTDNTNPKANNGASFGIAMGAPLMYYNFPVCSNPMIQYTQVIPNMHGTNPVVNQL